jgi:hypothetical protein
MKNQTVDPKLAREKAVELIKNMGIEVNVVFDNSGGIPESVYVTFDPGKAQVKAEELAGMTWDEYSALIVSGLEADLDIRWFQTTLECEED